MYQPIHYTAIDAYPLDMTAVAALNYPGQLGHGALFRAIHAAPWNADAPVSTHFNLRKVAGDMLDLPLEPGCHLIYYDAFAPEAQPELWTEQLFHKLYNTLLPGGVLVTYCSKSAVRRALQSAGFTVQKLTGPPGKREIVRAMRS